MFCQKCGAALHEGATFCPQCGAEIPDVSPVEPAMAAPVSEPLPEVPAAQTELPAEQPEAPVTQPDAPQPAQAAPLPSYDDGTYGYYTDGETPAAPAAPPKKKRRWILPVVLAAVLLLAIAVGGYLAYQKLYNTPERQVTTAALRTWSALEEQTGELDNLEDVVENYMALMESKSYETSTTMGDVRSVVRTDGTNMRGSATYLGDDLTEFSDGFFEYSLDQEALLLQIPLLSSDTIFRIPLRDFGTEFPNSDLADSLERDAGMTLPMEYLQELHIDLTADVSLQAYLDTAPEALTRMTESAALSAATETIGVAPELKTFRLDFELSALPELVEGYLRFALNSLLGSERCTDAILEALEFDDLMEDFDTTEIPYVLLGVNSEKQLVALCFAAEAEDDEPGTILLCGENNPWEKICFYTGTELDGIITTARTENGFTLDVEDGDTVLTLDDAAGRIEITEFGEPYVTIEYSATEQGLRLLMDEGVITMEPLTEAVTHLEGDIKDLLDMDLYELSNLFMQMYQ